jgi:aldehyde:ferredoxin oxidoreductase
MSLPAGYAGKVAIIDLSEEKALIRPTEDFFSDYAIDPRLWLGGDGFITKILWKDFPEPVDPLGPDNELIIATGPWTATVAPWGGRAMLGCISPETGAFGSGSFGWMYPATLKYAGFDVVIVRGKAKTPKYVFIDDETITFRNASHIWGKLTGETVKAVRDELEENYEGEIRVLTASVAGEHLVPYSPPCADGTSCPGRSGAGAVMGAKNLKALAVRGTGEISLHDPIGLMDASRRAIETYRSDPLINLWEEYGATTYLLTTVGAKVNGKMLRENVLSADFPHLKNVGCLNCPGRCYHWLQVKEGPHAGLRHLGGHMTFLFSSLENLRLTDLNAIIYYERIIQELGLDPASFSQAFNWAVECFEQGLISEKETDGVALRFGDEDLIWDVMRRVAYREGDLGNLLADGVALASQKIGKGSEKMVPCVKSKPYLLRDPNLQALTWALGFLTSPRGGDWLRCHNVWELSFLPKNRDKYPSLVGKTCEEIYDVLVDRVDLPPDLKERLFGSPPKIDKDWVGDTKGKVLSAIWSENLVSLFNSLVTCMFGATGQYLLIGVGPTFYSEILNRITGWDTDYDEVMRAGERVFNAQRLFNYRLRGWDRNQDRWSDERVYEPAERGIWRGKAVPWEQMLNDYYELRGWSDRGLPTAEKLRELEIEDLSADLKL